MVTLVLRLARREFAFELEFALLLLSLMLANTITRMSAPTPMKTTIAPIPKIHGQTLRFCGGITGGIGDHGGGGVEGGGAWPGPKAMVGCGAVSRDCGY